MLAASCSGVVPSAAPTAAPKGPQLIGLITKTDANPFFVKMRQGAEEEAQAKGAVLLTGSGKASDGAAGQVTAMENMISAGATAILITPVSAGVTQEVTKAKAKGVLVVALDSPTDPQEAADALFATDNQKAGQLIGQYAKAAHGSSPAKIAMLDEAPGSTDGPLRHKGFLLGYGIADGDPQIVGGGNGGGNQTQSPHPQSHCLSQDPTT